MIPRLAIVEGWPAGKPLPAPLVKIGNVGSAMIVGDSEFTMISCKGALLAGWAFRRGDMSACDGLARDEINKLIASNGSWALRSLWGNFLLVWADSNGATYILRAPVTGPAIYHISQGSLTCAFTHIDLARSLGFVLNKPDAVALDAALRFPLLRGRETGISGLTEILSGEIARLGAAEPCSECWTPWAHTDCPPQPAAGTQLRDLVRVCVQSWSTRFDCIQLELSGGLDSSIVAASMGAGAGRWRAVNMVTSGVDGDETIYARAVADKIGASLHEIQIGTKYADPISCLDCLRARPGGFGLIGPSDRQLLEAANDYGADAIFTGAGGDNVFGFISSAAPIVDALRFGGVFAAWHAASDLARMTDSSIWSALSHMMRRIFYRVPRWPIDARFLSSRYYDARPSHPWLEAPVHASQGQRAYVAMLMRIQPFLDGYDRALRLPMIAPLLSQPLVEFGLGVPSWQWCEGGRDRSLARTAFADDLPVIVTQRRTKGRVESLFVPAFNDHRVQIGSFLREGWLANAGLLDMDAIDAALAHPVRALDSAYIRLLQIADIERWARSILSFGARQ